jgi:DNA mismatch repair protein MSH5
VTEEFFRVEDIRSFTLSDCMFVGSETLLSLQIVQSELHPNSHVWGVGSQGGSVKESLSVYGLFYQLACTPQGKIQLQRLFLRPTLNLDIIHERQKTVSLFAHPENAELVKQVTSVMRRIRNIRTTVVQLRKGTDCSGPRRSPETGV